MLIFGEARGECMDAKLAVGGVVRNRVKLKSPEFGKDWYNVMLRPYAFDCFLPNDPNSLLLKTPTKFERESCWDDCYLAATRIYQQVSPDLSNGALFYFTPPLLSPPNIWGSVELSASIGKMKFWRRINSTANTTLAA